MSPAMRAFLEDLAAVLEKHNACLEADHRSYLQYSLMHKDGLMINETLPGPLTVEASEIRDQIEADS